jgi:hypothetical protein
MSIPLILDYHGMAPSASAERAIRHVLFRLEPLEGLVVAARVELRRMLAQTVRLRLTLTLAGGRIATTERSESGSSEDIAMAALRALRTLFLECQSSMTAAPQGLAAAA